jgi:hypothetical protein
MAMTVQVAGLSLVRVATTVGGALADFGYTQDGVRITTEGHAINIPGDENGGDEGPPIEIQMLAETARVRLEMTKWDATVAGLLKARTTGTAGAAKTPGRLVFTNGDYIRLVIANANDPWNFPCATLVRTPIELNAGTKFSRFVCEFECYKNPAASNGAAIGVLYNQTYA